MSSIWPIQLPQSPLIRGYNKTKLDSRLITNVDAGPPKVRNRFTAVPANIRLNLVIDKEQMQVLENFYYDTLENGTELFDWVDPRTLDLKTYRFLAPYSETPISGDLYDVVLELEEQP